MLAELIKEPLAFPVAVIKDVYSTMVTNVSQDDSTQDRALKSRQGLSLICLVPIS